MKLCRMTGEFASQDLAELAAGRIRRSIPHVRSMRTRTLGKAVPFPINKKRFTMLPANLRMENYITDVMISDICASSLPETDYRETTELTVICDAEKSAMVSAVMQTLGAVQIRQF